MDFAWLQVAANFIVVVGSVIGALKLILDWAGKPIKFLQKHRDAHINDMLEEKLKPIITQCEYTEVAMRDVIREKIMAIYHKNKNDHSLTMFEHEALEQYYKDYKNLNGNSYIDKYYARMKPWQIIDND